MNNQQPDAEDAKDSRRTQKRKAKVLMNSFRDLRGTFASSASGSPLPSSYPAIVSFGAHGMQHDGQPR
jgi:hypothetical protein